jgi:hypothetical protein
VLTVTRHCYCHINVNTKFGSKIRVWHKLECRIGIEEILPLIVYQGDHQSQSYNINCKESKFYQHTGWPGNDVPAGSPQEAPTWGLMGAT